LALKLRLNDAPVSISVLLFTQTGPSLRFECKSSPTHARTRTSARLTTALPGALLMASWYVRPPHRRLRRSAGRWLVRPRRLLHLFHGQSDAHDRADDPRTARRNKCRGSRTSTRASSAVVSKAIPLRQVGGGRATDAPQRWTSIICPPPRNFFARRNNSPPVGVSLTSGASHGTGERAPRCAR
jgi:hypothetical protein